MKDKLLDLPAPVLVAGAVLITIVLTWGTLAVLDQFFGLFHPC